MQADLFREPDWSDVPAPWPHATPREIRLANEARKLPPLPTAEDNWRAGKFHTINLGLGPRPLRNMHGVACEEWRRVVSVLDRDGEEIPISMGWWASDLGRVFYDGWKTGKPCWPTIIRKRSGHRSAMLPGSGQRIDVHRLVASAWCGWPEPRRITGQQTYARHLDGDPTNNRAVNLVFDTPSANALDRHAHGTMHHAKLTAADVVAIRGKHGLPDRIIADAFGVSVHTVRAARTRRTWRHVLPPTPAPRPSPPGRRRG